MDGYRISVSVWRLDLGTFYFAILLMSCFQFENFGNYQKSRKVLMKKHFVMGKWQEDNMVQDNMMSEINVFHLLHLDEITL